MMSMPILKKQKAGNKPPKAHPLPLQCHHRKGRSLCICNCDHRVAMILLKFKNDNSITQENYDQAIYEFPIHQIRCCCGKAGCCHVHGYYLRNVITDAGIIVLRILRVKCEACGRTHAILPGSLVPYSAVPLKDQATLVELAEKSGKGNWVQAIAKFTSQVNFNVSEARCRRILRKYFRCWKQMLAGENIPLGDIAGLTAKCVSRLGWQFMQTVPPRPVLFIKTT